MDGFIGCEVQVRSVWVRVEAFRQAIEAFLFRVGCRACRAEFFSFLNGSLAPCSRDDVIRGSAPGAQIHRQHGKLQGGATLQEHDLVIVRNAE